MVQTLCTSIVSMNFVFVSLILICNVRIARLDRYTPREVYDMHDTAYPPGPSEISYSNDTYLCFAAWQMEYRPEFPYVYLYCNPILRPKKNDPFLNLCPGFDCWESQLTMASRIEIVEIMNKYREKVAKGTCRKWCRRNKNRLVYELQWNYFLEQNATGLLRKCPRERIIPKTYFFSKVDESETGAPALKDIVVTSFKMKTGLQSELRTELWRLMYENHLRDWNDQSQFQRGDMHDVACAFLLRRNVNYVTALNETVENGIVGHFACVFATLVVELVNVTRNNSIWMHAYPIDATKTPSLEACFMIDSNAWFESDVNYYPSLCKRDLSSKYFNTLLYDRCEYFTPEVNPEICPKSNYSSVTWSERFYGLILKRVKVNYYYRTNVVDIKGQCHVPPTDFPQPDKFGPDIVNYVCTLQEVVWVQANKTMCPEWNCPDSQLTDATREQIVKVLNVARNDIAKGECSEECSPPCEYCNTNARYCNMVSVQWHWFLERKASEIVKNCPSNYSFRSGLTYDDEPFPENHETSYEEITLVFDLPYDKGQLALPETIRKLFWMNAFQDWTYYNYFRRGNAQYIGCSIITRSYALEMPEIEPEMNFYDGTPTHMVCIYATLNGSFTSLLSEGSTDCCPECTKRFWDLPCWVKFVKDPSDTFESLCLSILLVTSLGTNCQVENSCMNDSVSKAWYIQYEGLSLVQYLNGSLIGMNRTGVNSIGVAYAKKYCRFMVFFFSLQIPLWIMIVYYIFSLEKTRVTELLKKSVLPKFEFRLPELFDEKQSEKTASDLKPTQDRPSSSHSERIRTAATTTRQPFVTPAAKKTPVRDARSEDDDDVEDESEYEYATGPTVNIRVELGQPSRGTKRPKKERKAPKRAKTTTAAPLFKKTAKKKN